MTALIQLNAQESTSGIAFQKGEFQSILDKAKAENKLIFMDVYTTWCGPCKMLDRNTFSDAEVGNTFNAQFVAYKLDAEKGEGMEIAAKYEVDAYPSMLFINGNGDLVHRVVGYIQPDELLKNAKKAVLKKANMKPLSWFTENYAAKKGDQDFMFGYVSQLKIEGKNNTQQLNEYLGLLSPTEKATEPVVTLVVENLEKLEGPGFDLLANVVQHTDTYSEEVVNKAGYGLWALKNAAMQQALETKDRALLDTLIQATKKTDGAEATDQIVNYELQFAKATGDLNAARKMTEQLSENLMKLNKADLAKKDQEQYQAILKNAGEEVDTTSADFKVMEPMMKKSVTNSTAMTLNNLAWSYVETMKDKADWSKALAWSARSLELNRDASYLDTYANLLFRLGKKKEAIKIETEALNKSEPQQKEDYQATLDKMKRGKL